MPISVFLSEFAGAFSMVRYRDRLEIIVDILRVAVSGAKKTKIMYVANLSYRLLEKYLRETVELDFIDSSRNGYEITEKGRTFLEKYDDFSSKFSKVESDFQRMLFERETLEKMCRHERRSNSRSNSQKRFVR